MASEGRSRLGGDVEADPGGDGGDGDSVNEVVGDLLTAHSAVTSVTAARADVSSTIAFLAA